MPPTRAGHTNNLLKFVIWKCEYDRIVYIVKKGIVYIDKKVSTFQKRGF